MAIIAVHMGAHSAAHNLEYTAAGAPGKYRARASNRLRLGCTIVDLYEHGPAATDAPLTTVVPAGSGVVCCPPNHTITHRHDITHAQHTLTCTNTHMLTYSLLAAAAAVWDAGPSDVAPVTHGPGPVCQVQCQRWLGTGGAQYSEGAPCKTVCHCACTECAHTRPHQ